LLRVVPERAVRQHLARVLAAVVVVLAGSYLEQLLFLPGRHMLSRLELAALAAFQVHHLVGALAAAIPLSLA
jgi:hypothetical protein